MDAHSSELLIVGRQWIQTYNRYLATVLALKSQRLHQLPYGTLRESILRMGRDAIECCVTLDGLGYRPDHQFLAAEARVWHAVVQLIAGADWDTSPTDVLYVNLQTHLEKMIHAWTAFLTVLDAEDLADLGRSASFVMDCLEPNRVQQVLGHRRVAATYPEPLRQSANQAINQVVCCEAR